MPKEQQIQQYIRFGQIIRIHGHKCLQNQGPDQSRGMITVKGFTDKDAKYTTFEAFKNCQFYRQSLFQILPRGRFDKAANQEEQERIVKEYKQLSQNKSGQYVKFGDDAVFKHVDSHDYLSGSVRCSDGGLGAFKVELSSNLSQDLVFKLEPFRSFQREGDQIKLQSPLRIKNISNRCYISTQSNKDKKKKEDQIAEIEQSDEKKKKKMIFNIVTTYSRSFTWLIHLHEIHSTLADQDQIRTHDLLFLQHTKNEGYLCLETNGNPLIKLPKKSIDFPFYTSIWQIQKFPVKRVSPYNESNDFNNLGTQGTFSLRQLLNNEYLEVKHLMPATIVTDNKDSFEITIKSAKGLTQESEYLKNKGLIKIGGPKNLSEGQIDAGDILPNKLDMRYRNEEPFDINIIKFSESESQHGFRIQKLDDASKDEVLFILSTYQVLDGFCETLKLSTDEFQTKVKSKKLKEIDITLRKLIAFIKNCKLEDIEADLLPIKKLQFVCMDLKICEKLFLMLGSIGTKILQQIYKGQKGQNEALKTVFNRAYYLIWQIINNNPITKIYVCQDWLQIILNHSIQLQQDTVHLTLSEILQNNDEVVTKFLKENDNYLVKRIINIFALKPPHEKFLNIFSASCVSGNFPIVSNQSLILKYFLQQLDNMSTFILRYDIIQDSSLVVDNLNAELPKGKIKTVFIESYISKDHHDTRGLKDFFMESGRIDLYQTSNYFIAYFNLLADICYGKNAEARNHISEKLKPVYYGPIPIEDMKFQEPSILDVLVAMLQDDQMNRNNVKGNINLQRSVLRLITYAYIESADQNPVLRINRYRNLDAMEGEMVSKGNNFFNIMQFIKSEITVFKSFYSAVASDLHLDRKERETNSLQIKMRLYTILNILKSTLINGFWTVEEQQNEILPLLMKILQNNKEDLLHNRQDIFDNQEQQKRQFLKFKAEVSKKTPNIQKIIECKALACELIEIIFDFRFNNLVTESVAFYKDLQEEKEQNLKVLHKIVIDIAELQSDARGFILYNPELWQQKMAKILDNDGPKFKELKEAIALLIPLMVELSIHIDSRLFFRSLKILKRHFYSTNDIKVQLLSLSLFDNTNGQYLVEIIKHKRGFLNKLQEESALYLKDNKDNPYKEINNFLAWLSQAIQIGTNLRKDIKSQNYWSIFEHFNQESRIDKFHQRLIKNNDLHPILLKFLGLSLLPLSTFSSNAKETHKYVYRFLTLLAKNFKEAKKQMILMRNKILDHAKQESLSMTSKQKDSDESEEHRNRVQQQKTINYENIGIHSLQNLQILKRRNDCEAILLLAELFHDNKDILYDEVLMEQITIQISQMINDVEIQYYYKSHLLDFFRSLIYYKDKYIPINQSRILAKMQDSKKNQIYYMFEKGLGGQSVSYLLKEWENQNVNLLKITDADQPWPLKKGQDNPVIILQRLTYFISMMNLFSNLVQGKQEVNIGKCRQVHNYTTLINILSEASICYPLKAHLRNYINELYYSTAIQEDLCVDIIKLELPLIIKDLNTLIVILSKTREGRYYILHPIRYKYFQSYIYLYIEMIAYSLNYLMSDQTFVFELKKTLDSNYSKYKYYLHYFIIRIYERLRWILNYYYGHKYIRGFLNKITNKFKDTFLLYFRENSFIIFDKSQEKLHAPEDANNFDLQPKKKTMSQNRVSALKKRSNKLLHKLVEAEIGNYFTEERPEKDKNFPLVFFLPYDQGNEQPAEKKDKSGAEKEDQQRKVAEKLRMMLFSRDDTKKRQDYHSSKLVKLSQSLDGKDSFNLFMKSFIEKACKQLYEVDYFSKNHYQFLSTFVSFQEYIRIFVDVNTSSPTEISTDLKIFFFNILLQYIVQHNTSNKLIEVQNWVIKDFQKNSKAIEEAQIFLMNSNVSELLIQTLIYTQDLNLILMILQFGIAYLIGGNSKCQNSILQKVKEDKLNSLFVKIQKIITKLGKKISNKIAEIKYRVIPKEDQFIVQSIDRYDYYEQTTKSLKRFGAFEEESDEVDEQKVEKKLFGCLFKFMQLLCENNNIAFKNFIREQIDTDNTKKNTSFNILNMTTFQIRRLFKVMEKEASVIILPLTDFLNEVVALPCSDNQLSLCETTFFQDLCYMAGFFTDKDNLKEGGFDTPESLERLFELYQKCILVILNILQGNNKQLNKSFLLKLQVQFLLRLIQKYLRLLKIQTQQDLRIMLYDPKVQQMHVPVMLQNAINVMVVLLKLQESQNSQQFKERKRIYLIQAEKTRMYKLQVLINALQREILKIQICSTLGKQYIYFPKHPILTKLSDATRNRIMEQVSRSTQREKIKSLLQFKEEIFAEISHNFSIQKQKFLGIQISPMKIAELQYYLSNLSYIIIILWMTTTNVIIQYGDVTYQSPKHIQPIIIGLDIIQLIITMLYSVLYFKCKYTLAEYRASKKISEQQEESKKSLSNSGIEVEKKGIMMMVQNVGSGLSNWVSRNPIVILYNNDEKFYMVVFYVLTSIFGFYEQKLFMLYVLFYFMQNQTLENVFKAITFNLNQLFSVSLLGLVFVYVFCLIFYETYALDIMAGKDPKDNCDTIYGCILDLYVSGTIGGSVQELLPMRFMTDLIYYIFFGLLFSNIVSGIMIDTFAERRANRQEMTNDKKNKCYICGRDRGQLQKNNEKFDEHINQKHFLWNYIYYLYCLKNKDVTEYTGLQYEIKCCVNKGENDEDYIKWIPFGGEEADPHSEKIQELTIFMQNLNIETKKRLSNQITLNKGQQAAEQ